MYPFFLLDELICTKFEENLFFFFFENVIEIELKLETHLGRLNVFAIFSLQIQMHCISLHVLKLSENIL